MLSEEIFHYPFSDCEDRSVLFAFLVHELLNLEVVGVNYPGHMATAVCFNEAVDGDYLLHDGKNFVICDPTYINAPIGLSMPDYADKPAIIIEINKKDLIEKSYSKIRDLVESSGGFRGSTSGDIISDSHGNYYITGYFDNALELGNSSYSAENNSRDIFLAKYDNNMEVIWVKKAGGSKDEIANGIALDKNDNIYIAGYFEGSISFDDRLLSSSDKGDIFMAKYDANGNLKWCAKAGLDTMRYSDELIFSVKCLLKDRNNILWEDSSCTN